MLPHNGSAQMSQDVLRNETTSVATCLKIQFVESFGRSIRLNPFWPTQFVRPFSFLGETNCLLTDCPDSLTFQAITLEFL